MNYSNLSTVENDLAAIARLHHKDMAASKACDFATLQTLMTEDAVVMPPGSSWLRSRTERDASFLSMQAAMSQMEVLEYELDFEEVKVLGDYAFEWGSIRGTMRSITTGKTEFSTYKMMRILQKQPDGEWKVHRTIWNENPSCSD
jgi:uncharacterized protein (TIGR02246 family)